jgi:hypothetical protein
MTPMILFPLISIPSFSMKNSDLYFAANFTSEAAGRV